MEWERMPVTPLSRRQRQEDQEFTASLGYLLRPSLKTQKQQGNGTNAESVAEPWSGLDPWIQSLALNKRQLGLGLQRLPVWSGKHSQP